MVRAKERVEDFVSTSSVGPIAQQTDSDARIEQLIIDTDTLIAQEKNERIHVPRLSEDMRQAMINFSHRHKETHSDARWSTKPRKVNPTDLVEYTYERCNLASCSVHCVNGTLKWGMCLDRCHRNKDSILSLPAQLDSASQGPIAEAIEGTQSNFPHELNTGCPNVDELPPETHPANSWASLMKGPSKNKGFANLVYIPPILVEGKKILNISLSEFEKDNSIHEQLLVGYFIGRKLAYSYVKATLSALWALKGDLEMTVRRNHFFFKFSNWEDRQNALEHNQDGIEKIASLIGQPMYTDKARESKRRPFVRVCVEVMAIDKFPEQVSMMVDGFVDLRYSSWYLPRKSGNSWARLLDNLFELRALWVAFHSGFINVTLAIYTVKAHIMELFVHYLAGVTTPRKVTYIAWTTNTWQGNHWRGHQKPGDITFLFSLVYASNCCRERDSLWEDLTNVANNFTNPWILVGDFNSCFSNHDKVGGRVVLSSIVENYADLPNVTKLQDLKYSGCRYTWTNRRIGEDSMMTKIDRILVNERWGDVFRASEAEFLPPNISDHCPAIVRVYEDGQSQKKSFKYYNFWSGEEGYKEVVIEAWNLAVTSNPMQKLKQRMNNVKNGLKEWRHIKARKSRNSIFSFKDVEERTICDPDQVTSAASNHFMSILGMGKKAIDTNMIKNLKYKQRVKNEDQFELIKDVEDCEIRDALFSILASKIPGPDGFNSQFFQFNWDLIMKDYCKAVWKSISTSQQSTCLEWNLLKATTYVAL
ncbi:hypothetical protein GIB67_008867 [Kingdonia uniflora]|uniref:Endonuclease/exonuclease/phosphatase domain-containing protein n=1 Tax=Kingdonia uniflora TaxID=39325 RepID=A0A7J7LV85_9MAGN|nr:hypothetical protein GIB67_008867 [Kingdonia uniflora]